METQSVRHHVENTKETVRPIKLPMVLRRVEKTRRKKHGEPDDYIDDSAPFLKKIRNGETDGATERSAPFRKQKRNGETDYDTGGSAPCRKNTSKNTANPTSTLMILHRFKKNKKR